MKFKITCNACESTMIEVWNSYREDEERIVKLKCRQCGATEEL